MLHKQYYVEQAKVDRLVSGKNRKSSFYNGIYDRYEYPVLTRSLPRFTGDMTWMRKRTRILWNGLASTQ